MPEGHSIHRSAIRINELFAGCSCALLSPQGRMNEDLAQLDRVLSGNPEGSARVGPEHPFARVELKGAVAHGKHLFIHIAGERILHVHLGIYGAWTFATRRSAQQPAQHVQAIAGVRDADAGGSHAGGCAEGGAEPCIDAEDSWLSIGAPRRGRLPRPNPAAPNATTTPAPHAPTPATPPAPNAASAPDTATSTTHATPNATPTPATPTPPASSPAPFDPTSPALAARLQPAWPPAPVGAVRLRMLCEHSCADLTGPAICKIITPSEQSRIQARLGPDPLHKDTKAGGARFLQNIQRSSLSVALALMEQSIISGVGNIYRAELLFRAGLNPHTPAKNLQPKEIKALWIDACQLLRIGFETGKMLTMTHLTGKARELALRDVNERYWVYKRTGAPCRKCQTPIKCETVRSRKLYWCPGCQTR